MTRRASGMLGGERTTQEHHRASTPTLPWRPLHEIPQSSARVQPRTEGPLHLCLSLQFSQLATILSGDKVTGGTEQTRPLKRTRKQLGRLRDTENCHTNNNSNNNNSGNVPRPIHVIAPSIAMERSLNRRKSCETVSCHGFVPPTSRIFVILCKTD